MTVRVLIDANEGMTFQDLKVIEDAATARRAIVLAVNKWDIYEKDDRSADKFTAELKDQAKTYAYLPVIYISALTGKRVSKVISYIDKAYENWHRKIQTAELNIFLEEMYQKQPPAAVQGKYIKMYYNQNKELRPDLQTATG